MDLETSRTLGGIGTLLIVIGCLGTFGSPFVGALNIIGIILVLIALKGLSDHYHEGGIFNNALYGFILSIIGVVVFAAIVVVTILAAFASLGVADWTEFVTKMQQNVMDWNTFWNLIGPIIAGLVAALVTLYIFIIVSAILCRKSLNLLGAKSGVGMFQTAGLLLLIGAALTIIIVGFLIMWIAAILLIVAFFSIKPEPVQAPLASPPS